MNPTVRTRAQRSDWLRPVIVFPLGLVFTFAGALVAFVVVAYLPLGFYGDTAVPEGFTRTYESFFHRSTTVAAVVVVVLLVVGLALTRVRRAAARVAATVCVVVAVAAPWVWIAVACLATSQWHEAYG